MIKCRPLQEKDAFFLQGKNDMMKNKHHHQYPHFGLGLEKTKQPLEENRRRRLAMRPQQHKQQIAGLSFSNTL